ncbi:MAG: UDP-N-acetylglucosamine 2-epimerase, partial [Candidatus Omnitrophota bacterium]|nr:UDP-N-acetylglucosamine 2-epimerase [Candidatus Omnitrophota bacterium]
MGTRRLKRKICVVTGSRSDYGHLSGLMKEIQNDRQLQLQVVVTGMHLSPRFGSTYKIVKRDGFPVNNKVDILRFNDSPVGIVQSIGLGCRLFAQQFSKIKPDMVVLLGDRYEMLAAAISAYMLRIPIVHLHGGESSEGAVDEGIRHSITKMALYHFAAAEPYRQRIIQLGEDPKRVFNYGAPGLDTLHHARLLNKKELSRELNFDLEGPVAIITYHPVTLDHQSVHGQIQIILKTIGRFSFKAIFTQANADAQGNIINQHIHEFCSRHPRRYKFIKNLGQKA